MQKFIDWVIFSSQNASELSLTVKGFLVGIIPAIIFFGNIVNVQFDSANLTNLVDSICAIIVLFGGMISAFMTIFGAIRKIFSTITGRNAVIQAYAAKGK